MFFGLSLWYREWDLNPHNHFWSRDFKSLVSTDSTITALNNIIRHARRCSQLKIGCKGTDKK